MKYVSIITFLLIGSVCFSQVIDGIDITDLNNTNGWVFFETGEEGDLYMYGNPLQFFDEAGLLVNNSILFHKYNPTGMNYYDIYNHLVSQLGEEDSEDDYIPSHLISLGWQNDYSTLSTYINLQEARVRRYWFEILKNENSDLCCALNWEYDYLNKDVTIAVSFFYLINEN